MHKNIFDDLNNSEFNVDLLVQDNAASLSGGEGVIDEPELIETLDSKLSQRSKISFNKCSWVRDSQLVTDCLSLLDLLKLGLISLRGVDRAGQAYIVLDCDEDTENLSVILKPLIKHKLVSQKTSSKFHTRLFYCSTHMKKKKSSYYDPHLQKNVVERWEEEIINPDYIGNRKVIECDSKNSSSSIYLILSYIEVLLQYFPEWGKNTFDEAWSGYILTSNWPPDLFVKYAKYCTAYPLAKYLKNDLPPLPKDFKDNPLIFKGKIKHMLRSRLISENKVSVSLFWSILQGVKRAALPVGKSYIYQSLLDHSKILDAVPKEPDLDFSIIFMYCTQTINKNFRLSDDLILKNFEPSLAASHHTNRVKGGQKRDVEQFLVNELGMNDSRNFKNNDWMNFNDLLRLNASKPGQPDYIKGRHVPKLYKKKIIEHQHSFYYTKGHEHLPSPAIWRIPQVGRGDIDHLDYDGPLLKARVVAISEPLKVRVITAGSALPYYLGKSFQKSYLDYIQKFPQFTLTGETLNTSHLYSLLDREKSCLAQCPQFPCDFWTSGDYASATDLLNINYTMMSFDSVGSTQRRHNPSNLSSQYMDLVRLLLLPHFLEYGLDLANLGFLQKNGQLMGSPISFPFLCIINFVCYWISIMRYTKAKINFKILPCLINGDDILFRSNKEHYKIWLDCIKEVGFKLSIGKNYCHEFILTINSMLFIHHPKTNTFSKIDYFNSGLLMAQPKSRVQDIERKMSLSELYIKAVGEAPLNKLRAHNRFLHYNLHQIKLMTDNGKYNLFIPTIHGGLGFPIYEEILPHIKFTNFQRRFASYLSFKTALSFKKGVFPKQFFNSLVQDNHSYASSEVWHGVCPLTLQPFGPLEQGVEVLEKELLEYVPFEAPTPIPGELKYRLPPRSLIRDFSKIQFQLKEQKDKNVLDPRLALMENDQMLSPIFYRPCFMKKFLVDLSTEEFSVKLA